MTVTLFYAGQGENSAFPQGFSATHESLETATAQAVQDLHDGREPVRIEGEPGEVLAQRKDLEAAAEASY
jgi:outer membrane lipoprotein-sorting protein